LELAGIIAEPHRSDGASLLGSGVSLLGSGVSLLVKAWL
jgi:hypothetical protein